MWRLPRGVIDLIGESVRLGGGALDVDPLYLRTDRAIAVDALAVPHRTVIPVR